jgi:hypothetical protein
MEMSQGNSLYSYLKQIKMSFFYKNGEQECIIGLVWEVGTRGRMYMHVSRK